MTQDLGDKGLAGYAELLYLLFKMPRILAIDTDIKNGVLLWEAIVQKLQET